MKLHNLVIVCQGVLGLNLGYVPLSNAGGVPTRYVIAQQTYTPITGTPIGNETTANTSVPSNSLQGTNGINSLTQLQTSNYQYSSTTQFSGNSYGSTACGLSIGGSYNNSNTMLAPVYSVDVRYNTARCTNTKYQADQETKRVETGARSSNINTCIIARRDLAIAGKNPDDACDKPVIQKSE